MRNKILALTSLLLISTLALASSVQRFTRDIKPPTQAMLEHQAWAAPLVATTNYIKTTFAGPTSAALFTQTTFTHQPDFPRNLTITPGTSTGDLNSCVVTIAGTNIYGATISEDFAFSSGASTATTGVKAFATVTSASWAASCEGGSFATTWIIGIGSALGLQHCTSDAGRLAFSVFDTAYETTRGTMVSDSALVEKNTFASNGTMNGVKNVDVYYIQNFGCGP